MKQDSTKDKTTNLTAQSRISIRQTVTLIVYLFTNTVCVTTTHGAHTLMSSLWKGFLRINDSAKSNLSENKPNTWKSNLPCYKKANKHMKQIKEPPYSHSDHNLLQNCIDRDNPVDGVIKEAFQLLLWKYTVYSLVTAILQCILTIKTCITFIQQVCFRKQTSEKSLHMFQSLRQEPFICSSVCTHENSVLSTWRNSMKLSKII